VLLAAALVVAPQHEPARATLVRERPPAPAQQVTILSDAFGRPNGTVHDWGYAALVEYGGRRILFDTGNNAEKFAANVRSLGIDLRQLDAVVISHRHGDHTDGLRHLLAVNPDVRIYVPDDEYFGGPTPPVFFRHAEPSLPAEMQYFGGKVPQPVPHGSAWRANIVRVDATIEIAPGVLLVRNISPGPQFSETPELSLVVQTPSGPVVMVGCSHPGIERILESVRPAIAATSATRGGASDAGAAGFHLVVGGLHLVTTSPESVDALVVRLREQWKVGRIAPGHCSGEHAFLRLKDAFGAGYVFAGVGEVIPLP
jgi:7,8-dihydropterin-6-yl-methyl-4-(beta-D-ribofuranosyl)aminobenzene 5'-phosphate synthase